MDIDEIKEEFTITDDKAAEWALKKIKAAEAEHDRLMELVRSEREELDKKAEEIDKRLESETGYMKGLLFKYFETVEKKETKTQQSYKLLSGSLIFKKPSVKITRPDEAKLVEFMENNGFGKMVDIVKKPRWADFKKEIEINGDQVILDETGEVLDWIGIEEEPGRFEVK